MNEVFKIAGATVQVLVSSRESGGRYTVCRVEVPHADGAPLHTHSYEDGFFYILEGEFEFQIAEERRSAPVGTSLYIPRKTAYAFRNLLPGVGRFLIMAQPGGMDLFFKDLCTASRGCSELDWNTLSPVLEKHGITIA